MRAKRDRVIKKRKTLNKRQHKELLQKTWKSVVWSGIEGGFLVTNKK